MKIIEMITKDLEYDINFVDKAAAGIERVGSHLKEVIFWGKCCQIAFHTTQKLSVKESSMQQISLLSYFKKCPQPPQASAITTYSDSACQHGGKILYYQKYQDLLKAQMMVSIF